MILVVGSLNMDLVTEIKKTPKVGETILGRGLTLIPGGKGANQAAAIGKLCGNVAMVGKVGEDEYGSILTNSLKNDAVDIENVTTSKNPTGVAMILVNDNGDNSIVVISGANFDLEKKDIDAADELIKRSDIVLTQLESPMETIEYTLQKAKALGKYVILNPAPARKLSDDMIKNIDLLTPNETELEILSGIKIETEEDIVTASMKLIKLGLKELVVTLGSNGALYINKDTHRKFSGHKVEAIDTTAAGDSVNGALAVALDEGMSMDDAIEFAMKVGALTVMKKGAQSSLPTLEKVKNFFK